MRAALGIALAVALVNFAWMPGEFLDGDPAAWREEARSIVLRGELSVPEDFAARFQQPGQYFVRNEANGRYYSKYGIMNAVMSLPPLWLQAASSGGLSAPGTYPSLLLANLWNIALSAALATLLYVLAGAYTRRLTPRVLYVVATLYCSSLWFYQRAQNSEIYQVLFFTALFMCLAPFLRALRASGAPRLDRRAWTLLGGAWLFAALLLLTRISYALLLPIIGLLVLYAALAGRPWRVLRPVAPRLALALAVPPLAALALLAYLNQVRFGSPWLSGYHQFHQDMVQPTGRLADALWGYLFSPRFSVFLYFPLLIVALGGAAGFWRRHRMDAIAMASVLAVFVLVLGMLPAWAGEWTYGPRYLLFVLPVLALPALVVADALIDGWQRRAARVCAALVIAGLAYFTYLQVQVNRLPFWIYYQARVALDAGYSDTVADYFRDRHIGTICADFLRHRDDLSQLAYVPAVRRMVSPEIADRYLRELGALIRRGNWYWSLPREART
jgi:hypothetical protein